MPPPAFEVAAQHASTRARAGVIHTPHGDVETPAFAPVGTLGAVKGLEPRQLSDLGVSLVMSNAYHLAMRPGADSVASLGGLHSLAGWSGPMMTDSGGFQVFSLEGHRRLDDDGVTFQSPVDGTTHRFTPESVVDLQQTLGADLVMPLDVCTGYPVDRDQAERELSITHAWAARAREAHSRRDQLLYGIVQGSTYPDLREQSARAVTEIGFGAYAIGGVSVGETKSEMLDAVDASVPHLPDRSPRHLLGVGLPEDIVAAVASGIDTFDCVVPTRWARTGAAMTNDGRLNLRNAAHARDSSPIDDSCACYTCRSFSRGAIRHLVKSGEITGLQLLTIHNLHYVLTLVSEIRAAIVEGTFDQWRSSFLSRYMNGTFQTDSDGQHGTGEPAGGPAT